MQRHLMLQAGGAALGVILLGGVAALSAGVTDAPAAPTSLPPVSSTVPAGPYQAVCPEPARLLRSDASGTDPEFSPLSRTARSRVSAVVLSDLSGTLPGSSLTPLGAEKPMVTLAESASDSASESSSGGPVASNKTGLTQLMAAVVRGQRMSRATVLTADPVGATQPSAGGVMLYRADDGDLRGIAGANCQEPSNEQWFVGANTTVGAAAVLRLTNSSPTPAMVNTELFGSRGRITAAGSRGLLVAPGETRSIVLAGLAANEPKLAVRVRSTGGPVTASIQQSVLRGLTPGGVELLQPTEPAALRQFIPALEVQAGPGIRGRKPAADGRGPALQVVVPGRSDAVVELAFYGAKGRRDLPGGGTLRVAAGTVTELNVDTLPAGIYGIAVTSNVPVVASARSVRGVPAGQPQDLAWSGSGRQLDSGHMVALPTDAAPRLVFGSPVGASEIRITPIDAKGKPGTEKIFRLKGGTTLTVDPTRLSAKLVAAVMISTSGDAVYGTQLLTSGASAIAAVPVAPAPRTPPPIQVSLGY